MAKKPKKQKQEIIPEGMSRKDYADAAFRKKVTIINACILVAFFIGIVAVIFFGWYNNQQENKRFEAIEAAFYEERDKTKAELAEIEKNGGSHEDKSAVKIELTDDNYSYWIYELDESYQGDRESESYGCFGGAEIHLQGMFVTREFSGGDQYWVYRKHAHDEHEGHDHSDEEVEADISEMIPIEVIFDGDVEFPEDGTWVDIVGIVGPDSTKNLSGVRDAKMTIMDKPGTEYIE